MNYTRRSAISAKAADAACPTCCQSEHRDIIPGEVFMAGPVLGPADAIAAIRQRLNDVEADVARLKQQLRAPEVQARISRGGCSSRAHSQATPALRNSESGWVNSGEAQERGCISRTTAMQCRWRCDVGAGGKVMQAPLMRSTATESFSRPNGCSFPRIVASGSRLSRSTLRNKRSTPCRASTK